jgi:hypothetical protein
LHFRCFSPACRTNSVLHAGGEGENNSPPDVMLPGQADSGPALLVFPSLGQTSSGPALCFVGQTGSGPSLLSGPGPTQTKNRRLCWAEIGPTLFGLSPAQLVGSAQPGPPNIIYYLL